jgi:hypothetical protein
MKPRTGYDWERTPDGKIKHPLMGGLPKQVKITKENRHLVPKKPIRKKRRDSKSTAKKYFKGGLV